LQWLVDLLEETGKGFSESYSKTLLH
jgi:hypothetical protein